MITIYTLPDCVSCDLTERAFRRRGLELGTHFVKVPLTEEKIAELKSMGYLSAPVVVTETEGWYGLKPDMIQEASREALGRPRRHDST